MIFRYTAICILVRRACRRVARWGEYYRYRRRLRPMSSAGLRGEYARLLTALRAARIGSPEWYGLLQRTRWLRGEWDRRWHYQLGAPARKGDA